MNDGALELARRLLLEAPAEPPADLLYARWYHREGETLRDYPPGGAYRSVALEPDRFETGWTVLAPLPYPPGAVTAERKGERRDVAPPDCAPAARGRLRLAAGEPLLVDPMTSGVSGGFWHLWSGGWRRGPPERLQRLYLAVAPGSEIEAVRRFARLADPAESWSIKFLTGPHRAGRRDPAVLYLERERPLDSGWVAAIADALAGSLDGEPPPLTRPMAPGVAWAEDPGGGLSFGEHLCRLLAAAAQAPGALDDETGWRAAAAGAFESAGLDIARPEKCAAGRANGDG
jgi:hypothetical protein